ncbi:6-pyruvoyl tetrahydrobiopterin synthase isoform X3 [Papio anubis]|uniref:6-pyruvoyl tetrahydrobiopterin synthase isoform X3 n=1 Tax=Papio anubis TaxID=9555 RepID=UPI0012AE8474|nr:6-pyruvoyl tetrahydrobiopterin synthase isoform X3 [Papio anubis]
MKTIPSVGSPCQESPPPRPTGLGPERPLGGGFWAWRLSAVRGDAAARWQQRPSGSHGASRGAGTRRLRAGVVPAAGAWVGRADPGEGEPRGRSDRVGVLAAVAHASQGLQAWAPGLDQSSGHCTPWFGLYPWFVAGQDVKLGNTEVSRGPRHQMRNHCLNKVSLFCTLWGSSMNHCAQRMSLCKKMEWFL